MKFLKHINSADKTQNNIIVSADANSSKVPMMFSIKVKK